MRPGRPEPVWFELTARSFGVGTAVGAPPTGPERNWQAELGRPGRIVGWPDFECELSTDRFATLPPDVLVASFAPLLISTRLKTQLTEFDPTANVEWMPVTITSSDQPPETYWAPSLLFQPDVFVPGTIRRFRDDGFFTAGLDVARADRHRLFAIHRGYGQMSLHCHHELRAAVAGVADNGAHWDTTELSWPPDQLEDAASGTAELFLLPAGPGLEALPDELQAAVSSDDLALYDPQPHAESGPVRLRRPEFVIGRVVPVERTGPDDLISVRVVDFTLARHWRERSADLLLWLPDHHCFAAYDGDHAHLYMFPGATWSDIAEEPGRYLNAMWESPLFYTDDDPPPTSLVTTSRPDR